MKENEILKGQIVEIVVNDKTGSPEHLILGMNDKFNVIIPVDKVNAEVPEGSDGAIFLSRRFLGREIVCKVIERNGKSVIASHIDALNELKPAVMEKLPEGSVHECMITYVGRRELEAEIDNCVTVHIPASEYSYERITSLSDVAKPGMKIKVEIKGFNDSGKLIGSRKSLLPNPWHDAKDRFKPRNIYLGKVTGRLKDKGIFVHLGDGISALAAPIPFFPVEIGDNVALEVASVDAQNCKIKGRIIGLAPDIQV